MRHVLALIRFFYKKDPEDLTPELYAQLQSELIWLASIGLLNIKIN